MMTRWRAAWLEGMDADEGEPRERAVEEGKRVKEGFEALTTRQAVSAVSNRRSRVLVGRRGVIRGGGGGAGGVRRFRGRP